MTVVKIFKIQQPLGLIFTSAVFTFFKWPKTLFSYCPHPQQLITHLLQSAPPNWEQQLRSIEAITLTVDKHLTHPFIPFRHCIIS